MSGPRVWVLGGGGREHALVAALLRSPSHPSVVAAPGNPGFPPEVERRSLDLSDPEAVVEAVGDADLVVVGPEAPLVAGVSNRLRAAGIPVLGPSSAAARLEGSKAFAKTIMDEVGVPTARWARFEEAGPAKAFARTLDGGAVIKADGLAAGKGVVVAEDLAAADAAIDALLSGSHGEAGRALVVEERLEGEELSVLALCDGRRLAWLPPAQDHKRLEEGDGGPNTGGMGAYCPAPVGTEALVRTVLERCMQPVVDRLADAGTPLVGVLYAGVMVTADGPKVLEYNVRFGDPEAQAILPLVDEDPLELFLAAARGALEARAVRVRPGAALVVVLAAAGYPADPRRGDLLEGLDEAARVPGAMVFHAGTALDEAGRFRTAGGRVLGVTGIGADFAEARERAYAAAERVRFAGCQLRRDIGHRALAARP